LSRRTSGCVERNGQATLQAWLEMKEAANRGDLFLESSPPMAAMLTGDDDDDDGRGPNHGDDLDRGDVPSHDRDRGHPLRE